jgi:hypothetical protein
VRVIQGRLAEARVYCAYVFALLWPGVEVPVFGEPSDFTGDIDRFRSNVDDWTVIVDEGRRQLDRQLTDLERNRTRAATLLTISLAEIGVLSASAHRAFDAGIWVTLVWAASAAMAVLAAGGGASLLTSQAQFSRPDAQQIAAGPRPVIRNVALDYVRSVAVGEETIRARITVLRDGVLLAVVAALLYAVVWPFASVKNDPAGKSPRPSPNGTTTCPTICMPSSPGQSPTRSTASPGSGPATTISSTPTPSSPIPLKR